MDTAIARVPRTNPPIFEDGLGKRYHVPGPGGEKLEVLALHEALTAVSSFEFSLRERVGALAAFQNPAFSRVRGVQRLGQDTAALAIVSESPAGERLSEVLSVAEQQLLPLDVNAALYLIRQLVHAVAALHEQMHGISHGALAPERLVVAQHGRLVVVEHVLGAALEQLHFTHEKYWKDLGIPLPNPAGTPRFDQRADILQVGAVALALIVGRPLYSEEFPDRIGPLAERAWGLTAEGGVEPLPAAVRSWLARALQLDARQSFPSAVEARAELDRVVGPGDQVAAVATVRAFLAQYAKHAAPTAVPTEPPPQKPATTRVKRPASAAAAPPAPAATPSAPAAVRPAAAEPRSAAPAPAAPSPPPVASPPVASTPVPASPVASLPPAAAPPIAASPVAAAPVAVSAAPPARAVSAPVPAVRAPEPSVAHRDGTAEKIMDSTPGGIPGARTLRVGVPWWQQRQWIAALAVVGILGSAGTYAGRWYFTEPAVAEATGTLIVESNPAGAAAMVDGEPRGFTPLTLTLSPGAHTLEIVSGNERRTIPVTIAAGNTVSQFLDLPTNVTPTGGQLQVRSEPAGARVTVDGVGRGQAPLTIEGLQPGAHTVVLTNDLTSITHEVVVEAGATASLVVPMTAPQGVPVSGWISVGAPVDVQVYERDRLLGSSRSDRIMVAVGRHELEIVNESLGFRATRVVNVTPGQVSAIRLEWPNGSMAINAQPWAEVWINGERVGDTPIGNVAVPIGTHEVLFRHPELGEHVVRATVTLGAPTRLSVDMRKR